MLLHVDIQYSLHLLTRLVFLPLNGLGISSKINDHRLWVYFWILSFILLICMSILMLVCCGLDYDSFIVSLTSRSVFFNFVLPFQDCFENSGSFCNSTWILGLAFPFCKMVVMIFIGNTLNFLNTLFILIILTKSSSLVH